MNMGHPVNKLYFYLSIFNLWFSLVVSATVSLTESDRINHGSRLTPNMDGNIIL